jgi:hypothetical protein
MSGEHTRGPWSYRSQPHDDWGIVRSGRYIICQARNPAVDFDDLHKYRANDTDPYEANARLIASAPELLDALERIGHYVELVERTPITAAHNITDAFRLYAAPVIASLSRLHRTSGEGGE